MRRFHRPQKTGYVNDFFGVISNRSYLNFLCLMIPFRVFSKRVTRERHLKKIHQSPKKQELNIFFVF